MSKDRAYERGEECIVSWVVWLALWFTTVGVTGCIISIVLLWEAHGVSIY